MKRTRWLLLTCALALLGCRNREPLEPLSGTPVAPRDLSDPPPPEVHKFKIWDAAKDYVVSQMKSPSQTKLLEWDIIYARPPMYFVAVTTDSPNSFGVMLRGNFTVLVMADVARDRAVAVAMERGIKSVAEIERELAKDAAASKKKR